MAQPPQFRYTATREQRRTATLSAHAAGVAGMLPGIIVFVLASGVRKLGPTALPFAAELALSGLVAGLIIGSSVMAIVNREAAALINSSENQVLRAVYVARLACLPHLAFARYSGYSFWSGATAWIIGIVLLASLISMVATCSYLRPRVKRGRNYFHTAHCAQVVVC